MRFADPTGLGTTQSFASLNTFSLPFPELGPVLGRVTTRTVLEVANGSGLALAGGYLPAS